MERKPRLICRCRPFRGLALALFALFGGFATAAQAMLLTLDLRWSASDADDLLAYKLQEGSIIQVIGYNSSDYPDQPSSQDNIQFGQAYGTYTGEALSPEPFDSGAGLKAPRDVYLADNTQTGHEILYTGSVQKKGNDWYGLYTQITIDQSLYDTVYIRVFGATEFVQGEAIASYWGISDSKTLDPDHHYQTDTLATRDVEAGTANYFEVIPEPATLGLLGLGGVALTAWRRRRFVRLSGDRVVREED